MGGKGRETCGRCSMTTVIDAVGDQDDEGQPQRRDLFGEARIEVSEDELRKTMAPAIALGRVKTRLDEIATRLTYGRGR